MAIPVKMVIEMRKTKIQVCKQFLSAFPVCTLLSSLCFPLFVLFLQFLALQSTATQFNMAVFSRCNFCVGSETEHTLAWVTDIGLPSRVWAPESLFMN